MLFNSHRRHQHTSVCILPPESCLYDRAINRPRTFFQDHGCDRLFFYVSRPLPTYRTTAVEAQCSIYFFNTMHTNKQRFPEASDWF